MRNNKLTGPGKANIKILLTVILAFLFISCADKITFPEESTSGDPVLGSPQPAAYVINIGEGDFKFRVTSQVMNSSGFGYNAVVVNFSNDEDPNGYSMVLTPSFPGVQMGYSLGGVKINAYVQLTAASLYMPGRITLNCSYSKSDGSNVNYFNGIVFSWNKDGTINNN